MSARYQEALDGRVGAVMHVDFTTRRGSVVAYSVVLLLATATGWEAVRLYDAAHGYNEMHRYTRLRGKQEGIEFHSGTLGEGLTTAIDEIKNGYREMIEGWASG